jgi:plastocyanin
VIPRRVALLLVVGAVAVACAGGSSRGADASPVATTSVDLPRSYAFEPAAITVATGATVTWTNHDQFTHNVTLDGEPALPLAQGASASHTFATPGTYHYQCTLHPREMQGNVIVTG